MEQCSLKLNDIINYDIFLKMNFYVNVQKYLSCNVPRAYEIITKKVNWIKI